MYLIFLVIKKLCFFAYHPLFTEETYHEAEAEDSGTEDNSELDQEERSQPNMQDVPYPSSYVQRIANPELPETVSVLRTPDGGTVYVVGTAHFSENSQEDVAKVLYIKSFGNFIMFPASLRVN